MTRPWTTLESAEGAYGKLELRRRGVGDDADFLLLHDGRVLMNSRQRASEEALGALVERAGPRVRRVLVGGLGMGITLAASLRRLRADARVTVVEIDPVLARWCAGPLAPVSANALADPRVELRTADIGAYVATTRDRFDAILLDLYEGPSHRTGDDHPLYGRVALANLQRALREDGILAIWSEDADPRFERRMERVGLVVERQRIGRGARRHTIYVGRRGPPHGRR